eukprot:gene7457-535_t
MVDREWVLELAVELEKQLENVVQFWLTHTIDHNNGGFYNNVDRDGTIYDTTKNTWLQGRQVWMLARLYNDRTEYQKPEILEACRIGMDFLRKHACTDDGRVFFSLTEDGKPIKLQRKIFSECFYVMALSEFSLAINNTDSAETEKCFQEACSMFENICRFVKNPSLIGKENFSGQLPSRQLNVPMILLNVICELRRAPGATKHLYEDIANTCVNDILFHVHIDKKAVLETVGMNGEFIDSMEGRVMNPGHAIEAGWFLLEFTKQYQPENNYLKTIALNMMAWSFDAGWDPVNGGLFYFLDFSGYSPPALEWDMKLWWVHNEAMVGMLLAYEETKDGIWWKQFSKVADWALSRFPDTKENALKVEMPHAASDRRDSLNAPSGEWFGYLARDGTVTHRCIGAPYKGFFHVPRCLHKCASVLRTLAESNNMTSFQMD